MIMLNKKIIHIPSDKPRNVYPHRQTISLPQLDGTPGPARVRWLRLPDAIFRNRGQGVEGILQQGEQACYFQWIHVDLRNASINARLEIDPQAEDYAKRYDKRLSQGILSPAELKKYDPRSLSLFNDIGIRAASLQHDKTVLISDVSNYPWNTGFFVIQNGRLLANGIETIGENHWIIAKRSTRNDLTAQLTPINEEVPGVEFGFYVNPVLIKGIPLTLSSLIPGTNETLLYTFRGCLAHIFKNNLPEVSAHLLQLIQKNQHRIRDPYLFNLLQEQGDVSIPLEQIGSLPFLKKLHYFNYRENKQDALLPGDYRIEGQTFITRPKRALYGHTLFGITENQGLVIFKIFNKNDKTNGLYLEQLGPAIQSISTLFGENIQFAGVGANGGDVRTWLGALGGYKNTAEDGSILQEKLELSTGRRDNRPLYLTINEF